MAVMSGDDQMAVSARVHCYLAACMQPGTTWLGLVKMGRIADRASVALSIEGFEVALSSCQHICTTFGGMCCVFRTRAAVCQG